ncbi:laminin subunit beta-1 variant-like [Sarcophilus harrisii]|uniref:laminin subunit beta-1 variant-like n=1 Tax=Sarcophilus harrisii TaxID=9305 RepID=UPI001301B3C4|nr:laminin subunit beta-1 variant-like [Sarcophilus harrisii]
MAAGGAGGPRGLSDTGIATVGPTRPPPPPPSPPPPPRAAGREEAGRSRGSRAGRRSGATAAGAGAPCRPEDLLGRCASCLPGPTSALGDPVVRGARSCAGRGSLPGSCSCSRSEPRGGVPFCRGPCTEPRHLAGLG